MGFVKHSWDNYEKKVVHMLFVNVTNDFIENVKLLFFWVAM